MSLYRKIDGDTDLPDEVDVVIIGGGIIGASTALELAERGHRVALCEKGEIGAEQSCRNWGWVRRQGRDPAEIPLAIEAKRLWPELRQRVGAETGYVESGILYAAANAREMANHEAWFAKTRAFGLESKLLSAVELANMLPGTGRHFRGGLYTAQDGRSEPSLATAAIAEGARAKGAVLLTNCAVRGIDTQAGKVSGVVSERGLIKCGAALVAAGAWTRLFTGNLGIHFKQLLVRATVARIEHNQRVPQFAVGGTDFACRRRLDGGYSIAVRNANIVELGLDNLLLARDFLPAFRAGWRELQLRLGPNTLNSFITARHWPSTEPTIFERIRINSTAPYGDLPQKALQNLVKAVPGFVGARITDAWSGMIDTTPNALPVISALPLPGLFMASGFSGHGFGIGLAAGRLAAELMTGKAPFTDPAPFRFNAG
ncbi:NAD(P)/FAD-dependent oxidoreductase [Acidocella sp.]|uniref:NAD(P)/FAD-dependent oxidoreductase n=1 Tax=Acidocella sp. TaxID=50710 RepID=UPI003D074819